MAKRGRPKLKQKRRSRLGRLKRRARRVGSRIRQRVKKKGKTIENILTSIYAPVASVQLLSHNQVSSLPQSASYGEKIKAVANGITGSILDFNVFPAPTPQAHVHFDIEGVFNQYTAISIGSYVAGWLGVKAGVRKAGALKRFGSRTVLPVAISGALGLKNNNPDNGGRHSPYFNQRSSLTNTAPAPAPQITNSSGRI